MGPTGSLAYIIQHLAGVMGKQSEHILQERLGIGLSQFKVLMVLEWNPRVSQKGIADSLGQTEAAISRQVKALASKGLVASKPAPDNRRRYIVQPTPRGMQITEAANDVLRRSMTADSYGLNEQELHDLADGLRKLHRVVCRPGKPGACDHQFGL